MEFDVSYAAMSYLRDLVKKDKLEHWKNLPKPSEFDDMAIEEIQKEWDRYWNFHDMTPQITKPSCMVAILKECDKLEDECQKALDQQKIVIREV